MNAQEERSENTLFEEILAVRITSDVTLRAEPNINDAVVAIAPSGLQLTVLETIGEVNRSMAIQFSIVSNLTVRKCLSGLVLCPSHLQ